MSETLSEKRRRAGRLGAAARWAGKPGTTATRQRPSDYTEALKAWRAGRDRDVPGYRVVNRAGGSGPAELWIYDEIVDGFTAEVWGFGVSAKAVADELASVTADRIQVHINSPGGDAFEGHAIYNLLRNHAADVDVQIDGLAASAASYIAMAGDTVTVSGGGMIMIHDAIGFTYGNSADHADTASRLDKISDGIAALYAERAGGTVEDWRAAMRDETWYDATEAVAAGLADKTSDDDEEPVAARVDTAVYTAAARQILPTSTDTPAGAQDSTGDELDVAALTKALEGAFA